MAALWALQRIPRQAVVYEQPINTVHTACHQKNPIFPISALRLYFICSLNLLRGPAEVLAGNGPCPGRGDRGSRIPAMGLRDAGAKFGELPVPEGSVLRGPGSGENRRFRVKGRCEHPLPFCCHCSSSFKIMFRLHVLLITYTGAAWYFMPASDGCSIILYKREHVCFVRLTAHNLLLYNAEHFEDWCLSAPSIKARPPRQ